MTQKRMTALWMFIYFCPALVVQILAEDLPTLSIRYMTIEADEIVLAEPVDLKPGILPIRYKAIRALKGNDIQVGQEIVIKDEDTYRLGPPRWLQTPGEKKPTTKMVKVLLFLKRPSKATEEKSYRLVLSGIRALGEDKEVLVPQQLMNPGPQYLLPKKGEDWDAMLTQVRRDLPVIAQIRELGVIEDHHKRNEAIFKWIGEHKEEFGGGYFGSQSKGWASLEPKLFEWVMESCIPEDCWKAIELSAEVGRGPERNYPSFCSPRGRELLLAKFADESLSDGLRLRALRELGSGSTFWYAHRDQYPHTRVVTREEQDAIIDRVLPLLKHKEPSWRTPATRCLMSVSWPYDSNFSEMASQRGLPDLAELYRKERDTRVRKVVVEAIRRLEGEDFWEKLSGNPKGIVVILWCSNIKRDVLDFQMILEHTSVTLTEPPIFQFQELNEDGSTKGLLTVKPLVTYPEDLFAKGWKDRSGSVTMTVPAENLKPGLWRVSVRGSWEGHTWHSEPSQVTIPDETKDD